MRSLYLRLRAQLSVSISSGSFSSVTLADRSRLLGYSDVRSSVMPDDDTTPHVGVVLVNIADFPDDRTEDVGVLRQGRDLRRDRGEDAVRNVVDAEMIPHGAPDQSHSILSRRQRGGDRAGTRTRAGGVCATVGFPVYAAVALMRLSG